MSDKSELPQKTLRHSIARTIKTTTQKVVSYFLFPILLFFLSVLSFGCGSNNASPSSLGQPPLDTSKGEGGLISQQLVMTYPTATSSTDTGLDTFYSNLICPSSLSVQDCSTNESNLNTAEFGNFDVTTDPIANNSLGIKMVDAVKVDYTALNVGGSPVTVSGGVLIPEVSPTSLKGVVLYFHGTTTQKTNVPSNFTATTNTSTYTDGVLLAAIWASQGYVVVMPDYIGLGDDTTHVHPYVVYPVENAQSGLAMVSAAQSVLSKNYQITGNLPMYITGYSEGGAYALEAAHLMQDNPSYASQFNVKLRAAVPLSGFFDPSGTGLPYLFDNISLTGSNSWHSQDPLTSATSKPYLSAYLALSFANYSGISPTNILATPFYNIACTDCGNLTQLYFTNTQFDEYDLFVVGTVDSQAEGTGWNLDSNAITPLLTPAYANGLMQKDMSNPLYKQVVNADTYLFVPNFPVTLVSLEEDSVVTRNNTDTAFNYFTQKNSKGPYQEQLVHNGDFLIAGLLGSSPVDHTTELPFIGVLLLNQFNTIK